VNLRGSQERQSCVWVPVRIIGDVRNRRPGRVRRRFIVLGACRGRVAAGCGATTERRCRSFSRKLSLGIAGTLSGPRNHSHFDGFAVARLAIRRHSGRALDCSKETILKQVTEEKKGEKNGRDFRIMSCFVSRYGGSAAYRLIAHAYFASHRGIEGNRIGLMQSGWPELASRVWP
jgi:hypothetical protein